MNDKNPARSLKVTTQPPRPPKYSSKHYAPHLTPAQKADETAWIMREARKMRGY